MFLPVKMAKKLINEKLRVYTPRGRVPLGREWVFAE
jgi:hypothetical protein